MPTESPKTSIEKDPMSKIKYALIVIDMQLVAFDGEITPPITNGSQVLQNVSRLVEICREHDIPIIFLQTCAASGQPYAKDTHGWEIHPVISVQPEDQIVFKTGSDGFRNTALQEILTRIGATGVITCGIWTEYCVSATSLSAIKLGYKVCVAADGHGTVRETADEAANVVSSENDALMQEQASIVEIANIIQFVDSETSVNGGINRV